MKCPIDEVEMEFCFSARVLGKYDANYHVCLECRLIQPADVHWLDEAYSSAIASTDIGIIQRNWTNLSRLEPLLHRLCPPDVKVLDVGGGYGILCRGLRDHGFDCLTTDVYCQNLFARDFESAANQKVDVLVAFEVFEHIQNPVEFVKDSLAKYQASMLVFSTLSYDTPSAPPPDWWYYTFETGQHVSLYHQKSLQALAAKVGMHCYSLSPGFHLFSATPLGLLDKLLLGGRNKILRGLYSAWVRIKRKNRSLLESDYQSVRARVLRDAEQVKH